MRNIVITPEAFSDLEGIKNHLDAEYGSEKERKILSAILEDIKRLSKYPETDIKLFERFGIETDYKCIYSHKNYVFYRLEDKTVKVIRILSVNRDFLYVLLGIRMTSDESDEYWNDLNE